MARSALARLTGGLRGGRRVEAPTDREEDMTDTERDEDALAADEDDEDEREQRESAAPDEDDEHREGEEDDPERKAASAERRRIAAILGSKEARGRDHLAQHLALHTRLSPGAARAALAAAAKDSGGGLDRAMAGAAPLRIAASAPPAERRSGLSAAIDAVNDKLKERA